MESSVLRLRVKVGDSKDLDKLQNCISTVQDVIHQYGGDVVNLYLNERSDLCVLACFGMPTELHEDDPERAVLASMKIRAELSTSPTLAVIVSGVVFCGSVGMDNSKRYTVLGVPVCKSSQMMASCKISAGIRCDAETHQACTENGELFFRPCTDGTFTPYQDGKNEANKAWSSACQSAFLSQMKHRRDQWSKKTHKNAKIDENVANTKVLLSATESSTLVEILSKWSKSNQKGTTMYTLEAGLGHGKSAIMQHAISTAVKKNQNILYSLIDADPLTTSAAEHQHMASIASVLYDVFARTGRRTADQIEKHCISILRASGKNFEALGEWLASLNPIFPVNFGFRSDNCRKIVLRADNDDDSRELLEVTQRTVLVGLFFALSNTQPLLLAIDDALDVDPKSFTVVEDLITNGASILSQYNVINPGILDFLVKECVPGRNSIQPRKICVILSMHPFEDVRSVRARSARIFTCHSLTHTHFVVKSTQMSTHSYHSHILPNCNKTTRLFEHLHPNTNTGTRGYRS